MVRDMETVCVGNELLIGKISNTNAQWISKRATVLGILVKRITVVPDEVDEIAATIRDSLKRKPQFIVTTGGLGPTFDDKTLQGLARALERKLSINQEALRMVKAKYEEYFRENRIENCELTPPRVKMATLPEGTKPIPNPVGTAPAVLAKTRTSSIISLPGVPREMEAIFEATVAPMLKRATGSNSFHEKSVYADRIMESNIALIIDQVMRDNPRVYIKSHPRGVESKPHLEIHLSIKAPESEKPEENLEKAAKKLALLIKQQGGDVSTTEQPAE